MHKRPTPKGFSAFHIQALNLGLSYPRGRALAACNRMQNGWPQRRDGCGIEDEETVLRSFRPSTAIRWQKHWDGGGSIRSLQFKTNAQYNAARRVRDQRTRAIYKKFGIK